MEHRSNLKIAKRSAELTVPFPTKKYSIIYADPPWRYQDKKCKGNANDHYPTMSIKDICNLPVKDIAADDCALFL